MKTPLYIILYLISNLFRTYDVQILFNIFYQKEKECRTLLAFFLYYAIISAEYILIDLPILTFALNCIGLLMIGLLYKRSILNAIICSAFALALNGLAESIVMLISGYTSFSFLQTGFYSSYPGVTMIPFLFHIFVYLYRYTQRNYSHTALPASHSIIIFSIPSICIFICFQLYSFENVEKWQFLSINILLLILSFGSIWLYDKQLNYYEKLEKERVLSLQNQFFRQEIEHMELFEKNIEKINHDIRNHLLSINILAQNNNDTNITEYISKLLPYLDNDKQTIQSGNVIINGICNYYIAMAKQYHITVSCNVLFPKDIKLDDTDITILLGNLWTNCIENASECEHPYINFNLRYDRNTILLSASNSFSGTRKKSHGIFLSTKSNRQHHGIGIQNIQEIVNKYDGLLTFTTENNVFTVRALLYLG